MAGFRVRRTQRLIAQSLFLFVLSAGLVQAAGWKTLYSHVPAAISRLHLQPLGNLSGSTNLHLAIGLPLRNREALTNLLQQLYDPASPNYHHFLTPERFTEMFGPSEQDYQAVIAFAKTSGFTVTGTCSNRTLVDVSGKVADIQKAFHVTMRLYRHPTENRYFYAPDVEPSVPSALPILQVSGLENYDLPHPQIITMPTGSLPQAGSGPGGGYSASDIREAYVPGTSLTGAGQNVGLLQFDGFYAADVAQYVTANNIKNPPQVVVVPVDGGVATPGPGNEEVAMDIEMTMAMAPGVSTIYVYEAPNSTGLWVDLLNSMANNNSAKQLSCSWGGGEEPNPSAEQIFQQMAAQGQSFYNAVGDTAAFIPNINPPAFPSDSPNITQVGGTVLTTSSSGDYSSETVWNTPDIPRENTYQGSSGGVSLYYAIPTWQQGISMVANHGSTTNRNMPDVALLADNIWIIFDNGVSGPYGGGTSSAAPLWAGFTALVNQQSAASGLPSVGFVNPALYAIGKGPNYTADFHDIATGGNTNSLSPMNYLAVPGYDLCTGLGTPNGANLINALAPQARYGFLTFSVNPPSGAALIASANQTFYVTVDDNYAVTNATVTGAIPGVGTNTFMEDSALDGIYSSTFTIPSAGPLTLTVGATATNEIGVTNVLYYSVIPLPANDNFTNATKVPVAGGSYVANNRFATIEPDEPNHDGDANKAASLWWAWTPTSNTNVFIDTVGSKVENVLAVYTGGTLASLQSVAATNSDLALYQPAQLSFNAQAYTTYYIAVASASSNSLGSLEFHVTPGGQPDISPPVVSITSPQSGLTVYNNITNVAGTASDPGSNPSGVSQVFVSFNGQPPLTAIGTSNWTSLVALQPNLNVIQVTAVDEAGNFSATKTIELNYLVLPPANDFFAHAISLTNEPSPISATNTLASKEVGEPNPAGNPGGKSLWWTFTPPTNGVLTLNTINSTFDIIMGLYTGANVANLTTIADNDDAYSGAPGGFSYISQAVTNGQTYYILVDGYNGASGKISLTYSFAPATVYHLTVNSFDLTATNSGGGAVQLLTTNVLGGTLILPSASGDFANGTPVVLTAFPDHSHQFAFWTNDAVSSSNPWTVPINGNKNVTAEFIARQFTDGFESGDFSTLPWITNATEYPWFVQSKVVDVGQYAAQSYTNLPDSQSSSLMLTTSFTNGVGSFDFKVSSEPNFDILTFSVNGTALAQWSGEVGWANYSFSLPAGTNTLEWTYAKDATISDGLDAAFLDDVELPIGTPSPTPAQLQLQQQAGGGFIMNLTGQSGQPYVIQTSTDLVHWQNISTNIAVGGSLSIPLPANLTNQAQFYRAVAP